MVDVEGEKQKAGDAVFRIRVDSWETFHSCHWTWATAQKYTSESSVPPSPPRRTLIVRSEKARVVVDPAAKASGSIGAIHAVGQETRWLEIQGQGEIWRQAGGCFGGCRLCHIAAGRSKKGGRGSDETTAGLIIT